MTIPEVIDRFRAYHEKNPLWGPLHLVLEDRNVKDQHVEFCKREAIRSGDLEGLELARILLQMSKTQRAKIGDTA